MQFEDKIAIVTGAGQGIGEAYAKALANAGARVVVAEVNEAQGRRVAGEIAARGGEAKYVHVDVASLDSSQAMAAETVSTFGGIDFLINNAAVFHSMQVVPLIAVDWQYYKHFMDVNLNGVLLCVRACYEAMAKRGGGVIVNQSSTAAWMAVGYYGLSKLAVNGLTQALARELGPLKIRVNAIAPGPIDTEALRSQISEAHLQQLLAQLPLGRVGMPADLVGICLFLLSDAAAWITGHVLNVDGGQIMRP